MPRRKLASDSQESYCRCKFSPQELVFLECASVLRFNMYIYFSSYSSTHFRKYLYLFKSRAVRISKVRLKLISPIETRNVYFLSHLETTASTSALISSFLICLLFTFFVGCSSPESSLLLFLCCLFRSASVRTSSPTFSIDIACTFIAEFNTISPKCSGSFLLT